MKQAQGRRRTKKASKPEVPPLVAFAKNLGARVIAFLRSARIQRRVRRMQMVERVALGSKHSVALLRVDNQEFVVGYGAEALVLLCVKEPQKEEVPLVPTKEELVQAFRRVQ